MVDNPPPVALPEPLGPAELLALECEVLIPAALENAITEENTYRVKAKVVAEAANGPVTPEADRVFDEQGIFLIPDILCNAGLGYWVHPAWFLFTAFVGLNLFQSSFTNWCPMMTFLRRWSKSVRIF